jgi:predicted nucleic acid-binding protein
LRFLDANIFVRYLTGDDPEKAEASRALFERLAAENEQAAANEVIIAEVVFVLSSPRLYGLAHPEVAARLKPLLSSPWLHLASRTRCLRALDLYSEHSFLDFPDAFIVAHMEDAGGTELYSYDRDFDRVEGVTGVEP